MDTNILIVVAVVIVVLLAIAAVLVGQKNKSKHLKRSFGPEYDVALEHTGNRRKAEADLHQREKRVSQFDLRPLEPGDRSRFTAAWTQVQAEFVDDPKGAATHADDLLTEVMAARGYPTTDFEQRSADLSVEHPVVVQSYRAAREIALKHQRGDAGTEDLRQAMIHYRALFEELARTDSSAPATAEDPSRSR